jgi:serine/threonine protein kinase
MELHNKHKKYSGGKLLGMGAHGCVFDKELICNTLPTQYNITQNRYKNNLVTKMSPDYTENSESLLEWDISTLLKSISNYEKYFRIPIGNCMGTIHTKYTPLGEHKSELKKCKIYNKVLQHKNLVYNKHMQKYIIDEGDKKFYPFRLYFSEKADIDLSNFLKDSNTTIINYIYLPFYLLNIGHGLNLLKDIYIIHSDLKKQNILLNLKQSKYSNFMEFYNNIPLCRITDFGISKDVYILQELKVSSINKKKFVKKFCEKYKFSYMILPPEFNIISHLVKYHEIKDKNTLITEIVNKMQIYKLPFWDLDYIPILINKVYTKQKLDYNKIFKYFKTHWEKYDLYSFGLLLYTIFNHDVTNNMIINTSFGIFDYNIFKNIYIELAINLCNMNPTKRYNIEKVNTILLKIIDKYIYNFKNINYSTYNTYSTFDILLEIVIE